MLFGETARRLCHAAGLLGWTPEVFWQATPAELIDALVPPSDGGEPPNRDAIAALMVRFPDAQG